MNYFPNNREIGDSLAFSLVRINTAGEVEQCNQPFLALLGLDASATSGRPFASFFVPGERDLIQALFRAAAARPVVGDYKLIAADAEIRDVRVSLSAGQMWGGDPSILSSSGGFLACLVDLTTERAATRVAESHAALLTSVVAHANDAILITEAEPIDQPGPKIVYVNPAFSAMTGYSAQELIDRSPRILQGPKTNRRELDRLRQALQDWKTVRVELVNYRKDGSEFDVEIDISPVARADGFYTHWIAIQRDTTERRKQEALLRQSSKMEAVGRLTGGVAHDFNNVLTSILGALDTIRFGPVGNDPALNRPLSMALRGAERAAALTHQLLSYSRQQPLCPCLIDVGKLVAGMRDMLARVLGEAYPIELDVQPDLWPVCVDRNHMESAILNLAINARDAMAGGGTLTIAASNQLLDGREESQQDEALAGDYVCITISDTGTGMPKSVLDRAFDPFFTTKGIGEGTGLGLSQVFGFVKQSSGDVRLYSREGEGTTVKLLLPRSIPETVSEEIPTPAIEIGRATEAAKILLVEDDDDLREYSAETLRDLGYDVVVAAAGAAALRALAVDSSFRLLFTDIGLPGGMSGVQLAAEALRLRPGLLVLYTTGYAPQAVLASKMLDPNTQLLPKPYRHSALSAKIAAILSDTAPAPSRRTE